MKKNLYMIMCHKNLDQVFKLAEKLITPSSDVVVHIDVSVSDSDVLQFVDMCKDIPNLYITQQRIKGILDNRSLVDIVFLMINCVRQKGLQYKYYALLSGQDFPIKPIDSINSALDENYPKPFIDCTPYNEDNWIFYKFCSKQMHRLIRLDSYIAKYFAKKNPIGKAMSLFVTILKKICSLFKISTYDKLSRINVFPYGGSAWWILPDIAIDYIFDLYKNKDAVSTLILSSYTPEETYFQTLTMMSPIMNLVEINPIDQREQNCKTWAYFSDVDKPFVGHPYVFTAKEFEKLRISDCFFARKFDINTDAEIIQLIEDKLLV